MTEKRCNRCKIVIDCKYQSCDGCREYGRLRYLNRTLDEKQRKLGWFTDKYRTDEAWRKQKILESSTRGKSIVVCSECDKQMTYGHALAQKKCCRGRTEKTALQELLELSLQVRPLVESKV